MPYYSKSYLVKSEKDINRVTHIVLLLSKYTMNSLSTSTLNIEMPNCV